MAGRPAKLSLVGRNFTPPLPERPGARPNRHHLTDPPRDRWAIIAYVRALLSRPQETDDVLETQAYAAYVLAQAGKPQRAVMQHLGERFGAQPSNPGRMFRSVARSARIYHLN